MHALLRSSSKNGVTPMNISPQFGSDNARIWQQYSYPAATNQLGTNIAKGAESLGLARTSYEEMASLAPHENITPAEKQARLTTEGLIETLEYQEYALRYILQALLAKTPKNQQNQVNAETHALATNFDLKG
jgi:FPC/CPF motif-containing protein YcgG